MKAKTVRSIVRGAASSVVLAAGLVVSLAAQPSEPLSIPPPGPAATEQVPILKNVGLDQKLNSPVPLDAAFVDETGRAVKLGDYFGAKPVVLQLAYYRCPMLCSEIQDGMASALEAVKFTPGQDFTILVVSFDPGDTPAMAAEKRKAFLQRYDRPAANAGVHFLSGRKADIDALTNAVGFRYVYDPAIDQFAHPAAIMVLTADGRMSRYLFGIEFAPRDLQLSLVEASGNRIGSAVDQVLLYCYHYDPSSGKYGFAIMNIVRAGGLLTLFSIGGFILLSLRRERRHHSAVPPTATGIR